MRTFTRDAVTLHHGDVLPLYRHWPSPTCIVSDGAYGLGLFEGEPSSVEGLVDWYKPHVKRWTRYSTSRTTLWFWGTEVSWATVHPLLVAYGWEYRGCNVWDKGVGHLAGNVNTKTIRKFPAVTEVCAHYVRPLALAGTGLSLRDWIRSEWRRTGLSWNRANEACGVKSAATRKYLSSDALWYPPPNDMFERMVAYANTHGDRRGRPYLQLAALPEEPHATVKAHYERMRPVFRCPFGVSNVWNEPAVRGSERVKVDGKALHANQKPLKLMSRLIRSTSRRGDVVWEPFGGLCTAALSSFQHGRACYSAELSLPFYCAAKDRLRSG